MGILRQQFLQVSLGAFVFRESGLCPSKHGGELRPAVGRAHIDDADRFKAGPGRIDTEQMRWLAAIYAMPKFFLRDEQ